MDQSDPHEPGDIECGLLDVSECRLADLTDSQDPALLAAAELVREQILANRPDEHGCAGHGFCSY